MAAVNCVHYQSDVRRCAREIYAGTLGPGVCYFSCTVREPIEPETTEHLSTVRAALMQGVPVEVMPSKPKRDRPPPAPPELSWAEVITEEIPVEELDEEERVGLGDLLAAGIRVIRGDVLAKWYAQKFYGKESCDGCAVRQALFNKVKLWRKKKLS